MLLPRVLAPEDGKDLSQRIQRRGFLFNAAKHFPPLLLLASGFLIIFCILYFEAHRFILQTKRSDLLSCVTEKPSRVHRLMKPSSTLMHRMSDKELFIASSAPRVMKHEKQRKQKVAFMFLTRGPLPLSPLWEKFFKGNEGFYSIYVHPLPGYRANYHSDSVFYKRQIPSKIAKWGRVSMCDAERRLLANSLLDPSNERFVLLSESCIPLHNFSIIYNYLKGSQFSFVGSFDDPGPHGRGRYNPKMAPLITADQWRKGSQWFEVDRKLALHIVKDEKYYSKFRDFCKPPCYVDEHYFPTMLHIEASNLIANRSLMYVDWSRGGAHPATFGKDDISEEFLKKRIIGGRGCSYHGQFSTVCFLFGRKFAPSALDPLLHFAPSVLGFG